MHVRQKLVLFMLTHPLLLCFDMNKHIYMQIEQI